MRKVSIASKKQTASGCPTEFKGVVMVDGQRESFAVHYRGYGLTLTACGEDLPVSVSLASDGVCSWDEIKDPVLAALRTYFNSDAYSERLAQIAA